MLVVHAPLTVFLLLYSKPRFLAHFAQKTPNKLYFYREIYIFTEKQPSLLQKTPGVFASLL